MYVHYKSSFRDDGTKTRWILNINVLWLMTKWNANNLNKTLCVFYLFTQRNLDKKLKPQVKCKFK